MALICVRVQDYMQTKERYSLTFMKNCLQQLCKNFENFKVCLVLALDGGFGVELGFGLEFELWKRIELIQGSGLLIELSLSDRSWMISTIVSPICP